VDLRRRLTPPRLKSCFHVLALAKLAELGGEGSGRKHDSTLAELTTIATPKNPIRHAGVAHLSAVTPVQERMTLLAPMSSARGLEKPVRQSPPLLHPSHIAPMQEDRPRPSAQKRTRARAARDLAFLADFLPPSRVGFSVLLSAIRSR